MPDSASLPSSIPPLLVFNLAVTANQGRCLIHGLQDTYDANRAIALELLLQLPLATTGLEVHSYMYIYMYVYPWAHFLNVCTYIMCITNFAHQLFPHGFAHYASIKSDTVIS